MNRCSTRKQHSPYRKAWNEEFEWTQDEHAFGARALFHIPKKTRGHKMEMVVKVGIWVGRNLDGNEHVGLLIEWDSETSRYILGDIIHSRTATVYDEEFPLRMEPQGDDDLVKFEGFIDKLGPSVMMDHATAEEHTVKWSNPKDDKWGVKEIIGMKMKHKKQCYIVKWNDDSIKLEPESM